VEIRCLRHAESANVLAGASGAVPLAPQTRYGRAQAAALEAGLRVDRVYASPAVRARQTAELLVAPVTVLPELAEIGIGARAGEVDAGLRRETADVLRAPGWWPATSTGGWRTARPATRCWPGRPRRSSGSPRPGATRLWSGTSAA
jgi:broad specificity phosphatase PhoE